MGVDNILLKFVYAEHSIVTIMQLTYDKFNRLTL